MARLLEPVVEIGGQQPDQYGVAVGMPTALPRDEVLVAFLVRTSMEDRQDPHQSLVRQLAKDATLNLADLGRRYDRVIAAAVQAGRLPCTWVEHTNRDGVIVTPMRAELASGPLVRFVVQDDGTTIGWACDTRVGFMELRSQRAAGAGFAGLRWDDDSGDVT